MKLKGQYSNIVYGDFYWQIRYTNVFTGERLTYMNVKFASEFSAKEELRRIKREVAKLKGLGYYMNRSGGFDKATICMVGKNFRIRKRKFKK